MATGGISGNVSMVDAIEEKYKLEFDGKSGIQIYCSRKEKAKGNDDTISVPMQLCLPNANISHLGDTVRLVELCRDVLEIDLDQNLIKDWTEIFNMLIHIPRCSLLNLRANPLQPLTLSETYQQFPGLKKLVLNCTNFPWSSLRDIFKIFSNLEELHLSMNNYNKVGLTSTAISTAVTSLHFNENNVSDWKEIEKLGKAFPKLQHLLLLGNPIEQLSTTDELVSAFPNIVSLSLGNTRIKSWSELEKLKKLPKLTELRVKDIPLLLEYSDGPRRQLLIGYLPNITRLNGASPPEGERIDAERAFIRYYMEKPAAEQPTRLEELVAIHGRLDPLADVNLRAMSQASIKIGIEGERTIMKQVDLRWDVFKLKKFINEEMKLAGRKYSLFLYKNPEPPNTTPEKMEYPQRTLMRYRIENGDRIMIQPIDELV